MQYQFILSVDNLRYSSQRYRLWTRLAIVFIVSGVMMGCSGGGSDNETTASCGGSSVNDLMNAQVADTITGLTFTFVDGGVFQDTLAGTTVTFTLESFTDPVLTIMLATADHMAAGETVLVACNPFNNPACLFDVTVTESNFPSGEGPQINDSLVIRDWRLVARLDNCTNRITATLIVEDSVGMAVASESLDLGPTELCPVIGTCSLDHTSSRWRAQ